jgi:PiT family inorganic phosphate transporter
MMVRRVSHTMSNRISTMNDCQAFSANLRLPSSSLSLVAAGQYDTCQLRQSVWYWPTHKAGNSNVIGSILLAWIATLPLAGLLGAACWFILN